MEALPEGELQAVHRILRNLNSPTKLLGSPWMSSCLVAQQLRDSPEITGSFALKKVFTETLSILEAESSLLADILKGRFWEELEVKTMLADERPQAMSERTFSNRQKEAIHRFTYLLLEKERSARKTCQRQMKQMFERKS